MDVGYLAHAEHSAYNALYDRPAVLATLGNVAGLDVLDAGCGPGLYAEELARRGARVQAVDASRAQVRIASSRLGGAVHVQQAVLGEPLPFADTSFDLIVCALVVHYIADRQAAYQDFLRVLRPGGRAVVSTQHPMTNWLRKRGSYNDVRLEEDVWHTTSGDVLVRWWREPLTAVCAAATDAGFLIRRLIEPPPDPDMEHRFPEDHARLMTCPDFVVLDLVKPS